jgi:hypothetical protein
MRNGRSSAARAAVLAAVLAGTSACGEAPPSYRVVSLGEARSVLEQPGVSLLDAVGAQAEQPRPLASGFRWRVERGALTPPQELPIGGVLVVASDERTAHRSAAALARRQFHPVYVYIARSAEDRSRLEAHAPATEELTGGRDS